MSSTKLTPLEVLQRQKLRLQLKSEALTDTLEENLNYLQQNAGTLLGNSAVDAVVSKLDFLPLFLKGTKGLVIKLILRQLKKIFFKNK